jgi:DNA-binding transcriptional MocR family regulator
MPDLSSGAGPLYVRLADQIERGIAEGALPGGAKLPPQRNLAFDIGVTLGTVSRAYALACERGLVTGEVGRGTYVRTTRVADLKQPSLRQDPRGSRVGSELGSDVIRFDTTAAPGDGVDAIVRRMTEEICREHPAEVATYIRAIPRDWLEAGARWLGRAGWKPEPSNVVPTQGAHAAIMAVIAATTAPGDRIVFEDLTYASIARSAALMGRRAIVALPDRDGLVPEDFERLCAQQHPKLVFLMPAPQNPTLSMMPEERRRAIAEIARRYQVWILEDAIYGVLLDEDTPLLAAFAPEHVFHVGGLSKAVAAGLRGGWVACPPNFASRVSVAHKMVTGGKPFLMAELAARLVLSGAASEIRAATLTTIASRVQLARDIFAGLDVRLDDRIPFLWLTLPEPWLSGLFKNAAARENIMIDDEDEYRAARSERVYHAVRVGFSTVPDLATVAAGFHTLRQLLDQGPVAYDTYN